MRGEEFLEEYQGWIEREVRKIGINRLLLSKEQEHNIRTDIFKKMRILYPNFEEKIVEYFIKGKKWKRKDTRVNCENLS